VPQAHRIGLLAALLAGIVVLGAGGCASTQTSASSSSPSPAPLAEMRALALHHHATEAWYARVPLSSAFKLLQGSWGGSGEPTSATTPVYVVIMKGDFGVASNGHRYNWAGVHLETNGTNFFTTENRLEAPGVSLTPLPLTP
jgi:hypothetical protein